LYPEDTGGSFKKGRSKIIYTDKYVSSKGTGYSPPKGNSPGPKFKKWWVQWAPKLKKEQKPRAQLEKEDAASTQPPIPVRRHLLLPILTAAAATVPPTSAPSCFLYFVTTLGLS
jgi:hypothetical protein